MLSVIPAIKTLFSKGLDNRIKENDKNFKDMFRQLMNKALEVEFIISRKMLIVTTNDANRESVKIRRISLDLHGDFKNE